MSTGNPTVQPFDLANEAGYQAWRAVKLTHYPVTAADLIVRVGTAAALTKQEYAAILQRCRRNNLAQQTLAKCG